MNQPQYFEIQANDLLRAKAFYEAAFGWIIVEQQGMQTAYYRITTRGIAGGLLPRTSDHSTLAENGTNAATLSMEVTDYDETLRKIIEAGGKEVLAKFAIPGRCWQGYFINTEGNTLGIFEVDKHAS